MSKDSCAFWLSVVALMICGFMIGQGPAVAVAAAAGGVLAYRRASPERFTPSHAAVSR